MKAGISSSDLVHLAFRLLKQSSYYGKMDPFLRAEYRRFDASAESGLDNDPRRGPQDSG